RREPKSWQLQHLPWPCPREQPVPSKLQRRPACHKYSRSMHQRLDQQRIQLTTLLSFNFLLLTKMSKTRHARYANATPRECRFRPANSWITPPVYHTTSVKGNGFYKGITSRRFKQQLESASWGTELV